MSIDFTDITYSSAEAYVWSAVEPGLAITLACVPLLRPLLGGKHSPTGTALNTLPKARARTGTSARGQAFRRIHEESSSEYRLQPVDSKDAGCSSTSITKRDNVGSTSETSSVAEEAPSEAVAATGNAVGVEREWRVGSEANV